MTEHTIVVRRAQGGFSVVIEPPCPQHPPHAFCDLRSARGYASGLRIATGWAKLELIGEDVHG